MKRINLFENKEIKKIVRESLSFEDFKKLLLEYKPKEIFDENYSSNIPCFYITEYIIENDDLIDVKFYAHTWSKQLTKKASIKAFFNHLNAVSSYFKIS